MNTRRAVGLLAASALAAVCFLFLLPGCSEKEGGTRDTGLPPDTFISFGPKQATLTYFKVQAYWYGADQDGDVAYFQYTTIRGVGESDFESIDLDTLSWHDTYEQERIFILPADSCCLDSLDNPEQDPQYANALWGITEESEIDARVAEHDSLRSEDVAEAVVFMLSRPPHVTIRNLVMLPQSQDL